MASNFHDTSPILSNSQVFVRPKDGAERTYLESLVREDYDRAHPDDSFDDMKRRAPFSPEDRGLYRDWFAIAAARAVAAVSVMAAAE
ncbi:MAG TPA: hypothetical protein VFJ18_07370 [Pararhizobium sp.]|nr:hypothetical protein [Pararhizobium sp.]